MPSDPAAPARQEPNRAASVPLVWVDCEMTGLDLAVDALVEIACVVTDAQLQPLDEGVSVVIRPPDAAWRQMSEFVRAMHDASGLLPLVQDGTDLPTATDLVLSYVRKHVPDARRAPLAGSSVYVDRGFLARDMPTLDAHLHYRLVDVSSIKELVRRWYPKVYFGAPAKTGNHRALGDVWDSIAELRYYRSMVFDGAVRAGAGAEAPTGAGTL